MPDLVTEMETITPQLAEKYLESNTRNRPVSKPYVRQLAQELEQGRWQPTHQGIAFDYNGVLVDGQHRLMAIVSSGVTALVQVTRGVDPETFHAIDQHRRRTAAQILAMGGIAKDGPRIAAMARTIRTVVYKEHHVSNTAASQYALDHQQVFQLFLPVARKYTPAVAAAFGWCHLLGWTEVLDAAVRLVEKLWDSAEDPMRALDRRSEDFKRTSGAAGIKQRFDTTLNCLQAIHEGRGLKVARPFAPDYAAIERASALQRPQAPVEPEVEESAAPASSEPPPGSQAAGPADPELDAIIREQVAKGRTRAVVEEDRDALKSLREVLADATVGSSPAMGDGRVVRRKARGQHELDAALDAAVRAANGR